MAISYPHVKTIIVFLICLAIIALTITYSYGQTTFKYANPVKVTSTGDTLTSNNDWKKQFLDNSTAGNFKTPTNTKTSTVSEGPLSATELLARNFFAQYVDLRQAGQTSNQQAVNSVANDLIAESVGSIKLPTAYTLSNLQIKTNPDAAYLQSYGRSIYQTIISYTPTSQNNQAEIATRALEKGDMTILKEIDPLIVNYQKAVTTLLSIPAPQALAQYQVDLINGFNIALFDAKALRKTDSDPVTAMAAVKLELVSLQMMNNAQTGIKQYLNRIGIPFGI
jgi:hypothetical protein